MKTYHIQPVRLHGGHKGYTVVVHLENGKRIRLGCWSYRRERMIQGSSLANAERFANELQAGVIRNGWDSIPDLMHEGEPPRRRRSVAKTHTRKGVTIVHRREDGTREAREYNQVAPYILEAELRAAIVRNS